MTINPSKNKQIYRTEGPNPNFAAELYQQQYNDNGTITNIVSSSSNQLINANPAQIGPQEMLDKEAIEETSLQRLKIQDRQQQRYIEDIVTGYTPCEEVLSGPSQVLFECDVSSISDAVQKIFSGELLLLKSTLESIVGTDKLPGVTKSECVQEIVRTYSESTKTLTETAMREFERLCNEEKCFCEDDNVLTLAVMESNRVRRIIISEIFKGINTLICQCQQECIELCDSRNAVIILLAMLKSSFSSVASNLKRVRNFLCGCKLSTNDFELITQTFLTSTQVKEAAYCAGISSVYYQCDWCSDLERYVNDAVNFIVKDANNTIDYITKCLKRCEICYSARNIMAAAIQSTNIAKTTLSVRFMKLLINISGDCVELIENIKEHYASLLKDLNDEFKSFDKWLQKDLKPGKDDDKEVNQDNTKAIGCAIQTSLNGVSLITLNANRDVARLIRILSDGDCSGNECRESDDEIVGGGECCSRQSNNDPCADDILSNNSLLAIVSIFETSVDDMAQENTEFVCERISCKVNICILSLALSSATIAAHGFLYSGSIYGSGELGNCCDLDQEILGLIQNIYNYGAGKVSDLIASYTSDINSARCEDETTVTIERLGPVPNNAILPDTILGQQVQQGQQLQQGQQGQTINVKKVSSRKSSSRKKTRGKSKIGCSSGKCNSAPAQQFQNPYEIAY